MNEEPVPTNLSCYTYRVTLNFEPTFFNVFRQLCDNGENIGLTRVNMSQYGQNGIFGQFWLLVLEWMRRQWKPDWNEAMDTVLGVVGSPFSPTFGRLVATLLMIPIAFSPPVTAFGLVSQGHFFNPLFGPLFATVPKGTKADKWPKLTKVDGVDTGAAGWKHLMQVFLWVQVLEAPHQGLQGDAG